MPARSCGGFDPPDHSQTRQEPARRNRTEEEAPRQVDVQARPAALRLSRVGGAVSLPLLFAERTVHDQCPSKAANAKCENTGVDSQQ
jgi:hypothetical protein